jgi:hypothetical protein
MRAALVLLALSALAAVVALNVFLLGRGSERHDPVGNLSPIASGLRPAPTPTPAPRPPVVRGEPDD